MAEFQEMVREFHRLCETQKRLHKNTCDKCPIKIAAMGTMFQCYRYILEEPKEAENTIMSWAAEHPEPVYPSWIDWLMSEGIIPTNYMAANSTDSRVRAGTFYVTSKAFEHIPADIAQKLGIEPKEKQHGSNNDM